MNNICLSHLRAYPASSFNLESFVIDGQGSDVWEIADADDGDSRYDRSEIRKFAILAI